MIKRPFRSIVLSLMAIAMATSPAAADLSSPIAPIGGGPACIGGYFYMLNFKSIVAPQSLYVLEASARCNALGTGWQVQKESLVVTPQGRFLVMITGTCFKAGCSYPLK
jgi:hypothetical protein